MNIFYIVIGVLCLLILNLMLLFVMIVKQRNKPDFILTWTFVIVFFPVLGFLLYLFFGLGLNKKIKRQLKRKKNFSKEILFEKTDIKQDICQVEKYIQNLGGSKKTNANVQIFEHSVDKIKALKNDIKRAKKSINIEYYIFQSDKIGREIMFLLCKKAKQGVKVNFIYDAVGSKKTSKSFFKKLKKYGGQVKVFFPPFLNISLFNTRYNYRNHRKIVVIDNTIAYFGGMNICLDIVNKKKIRPWKDIHYRITGEAVKYFQQIFFADFLFLKGKIDDIEYYFEKSKKIEFEGKQRNQMQVISSGPEETLEKSKDIIIKLMSMAKEKIFIQSPYFVPDNCLLLAIKQACLSGIKVEIMLPKKQDRKLLQTIGFYYALQLIDFGVDFYLYDGFLHSKQIIIDNNYIFSGSGNYDNRSFSLNFEVNALFSDRETISKLEKIYVKDFKNSEKLSKKYLLKYGVNGWFVSVLAQLISPFL